MPFKDECGICKRVLPTGYLRKCQRCGRLYCRDCMVPDVVNGDPRRLFCLNCARRVVSPTTASKYSRLAGYLQFRGAFTSSVKLSLARIDGIIGENLPMSAYRSEKWWDNSPSSPHAQGWLDAGWAVQEVNLKEGHVVFKRVKHIASKRKPPTAEIKKPFTPIHVRIPMGRKPSKTKVSKLYARIRNLERQQTSIPLSHGSLRPRTKYEKKLFRPQEKPRRE
jgi:hypothetical protein